MNYEIKYADGPTKSPLEAYRVLGSATKCSSSNMAAWTNSHYSRLERNRVNLMPVRVKRACSIVVTTLGSRARLASSQALKWCPNSARNCLSAKLNLTRYFCFWELTWLDLWPIEATGPILNVADNSTNVPCSHFGLHILRVMTHVRITRPILGVCP